jgi:hypothetical protein
MDALEGSLPETANVANYVAPLQRYDAPMELRNRGDVVRRHKDRRAAAIDVEENVENVGARVGVEVAGRLIGQQHLWIVDERPRNRDALLLASGEFGRACVGAVEDSEAVEEFGDSLLDLLERMARSAHGVSDVFPDLLVGKEQNVLRDEAYLASQLGNGAFG